MPDSTHPSYVLRRNYRASSRLNLQHHLWTTLFPTPTGLHPLLNDLIHPPSSSQSTSPPTPTPTETTTPTTLLADLATGTAILLTSLAPSLPPTTHLHGFDISPAQFPHSSFLPPNVQLFVADATVDPATEFRGRYDAVHVRMLNAAIEGDDPGPVLRHAWMLVKEGGVVQWDEIDFWALKRGLPLVNGGEEGEEMVTPCLDGIVDVFRHTKGTRWISNLSSHFTNNSFSVLFDDLISLEPWKRQQLMEIWCLVTDEFAETLADRGEVEKAAQVRKLVEGASEEIRRGAYYEHWIRVVVGRKGGGGD